jgi:PAS domain-containing protein
MLMVMTLSHDGAPEPAVPDSASHAPGTQARSPDTVEALVGSSDVPLAAVDLPSGRVLAVNPPLASALGSTVDALTGSSSLDWLSPDDRHAAQLGFQAPIATDLFVSRSTVRNHLSSIYAKLGVHTQVDLVRLIRRGTKRPAAGQ